jgi:hypothetical protein
MSDTRIEAYDATKILDHNRTEKVARILLTFFESGGDQRARVHLTLV